MCTSCVRVRVGCVRGNDILLVTLKYTVIYSAKMRIDSSYFQWLKKHINQWSCVVMQFSTLVIEGSMSHFSHSP